jgi:RHS repeat-associated protein
MRGSRRVLWAGCSSFIRARRAARRTPILSINQSEVLGRGKMLQRICGFAGVRVAFSLAIVLSALSATACNRNDETEGERLGASHQPLSSIAIRTFGFESLSDWTAAGATTRALSADHSEGAFSLALTGGGWMEITSRALSKELPAPNVIGYDVRVAPSPINPQWYGTTQLFLNAPSAGIFNQFVGHAELTPLPPGHFQRVEFTVPAALRTKLNANYTDLQLKIAVNVSNGEPASYRVDRFTFGPASQCSPQPDGNPCTDDICDNGVPAWPARPVGSACDTNNTVCDGVGTCSASAACQMGQAPAIDDGNPCTSDACDPVNGAVHLPVASGVSCESDGNVCNGISKCNGAGACSAGTPPPLDDGNPCTDDSCDAVSGVQHAAKPAGTSCDADANVCNGDAVCAAVGVCNPQPAPTVDDGDPCTVDSCDPTTGVKHAPAADGAACDDGNACTGADECQAGVCVAGTPTICVALDQCHDAGACNPVTGECTTPPKADGATCSDGDACTLADLCTSGVCTGTNPVTCVAQDLCHSAGSCDATTGTCSNPVAPDGAACDDSTVCNGHEACQSGGCVASAPLSIDDSNPCTADACDPTSGVMHTAVANGTSCESDGDLCNGVSTCQSGACAEGAAPSLNDGNPCTTDSCDPVAGVTHSPVATGLSCGDADVCNGDERCDATGTCAQGTPLAIDDGDACTFDDCDPAIGVTHDPIDGCQPTSGVPGQLFEARASILGRVVRPDSSPVTAFSISVFDERLDVPERPDVLTDASADGGFRAKLTSFPESLPERSPPQKVILRVEGPEFPTIYRTLYLRPRDAASVGDLVVLPRDAQVTVIGPQGGTAQSSNGNIEVQIPAGALSEPTPIRITPIPERRLFPTPLPDSTITMYGVELEPDGTTFAIPAQLRIRNTLNLPTTMVIPVASVGTTYGDWEHEGFATWDGARFTASITHFSSKDANASRQGELVEFRDDGVDKNKSKAVKCVGSSVGYSSGGLNESIDLPGYAAGGVQHAVTLNFNGSLGGSVALGTRLGAELPPGGPRPFIQTFSVPKVRFECASPGGSGSQSGCGTGIPCATGSSGVASPTPLSRRIGAFGKEGSSSATLPAGSAEDDGLVNVNVPLDANGVPVRSGYHPIKFTSGLSLASSCAVGGAGFAVASVGLSPTGGFASGNATRVAGDQGALAEFPTYELFYHRRGSPIGSGWAIEQAKTAYRTPDRLSADIVDGEGQRETFRPYPQTKALGNASGLNARAVGTDPQTGKVFVVTDSQGIQEVAPDTGVRTFVAAFSGPVVSLKVAYVNGERRFLAATRSGLYEVNSAGNQRLVHTFQTVLNDTTRLAGLAGVGKYAYFTEDLRPTSSVTMVDAVAVRRVDLTVAGAAAEDITPSFGGDLRLDPHGETTASGFQFLHPRGVAPAFDGGLYVADDRRHAVYHLAPDATGQVGPTSVVTRVLGSGVDTTVTGLGEGFPGPLMPLRAPGELAVSPDGTLFVTTSDWSINFASIVTFDPVSNTARTLVIDKTSARKQVELAVQGASIGPVSADSFVLAYNSSLYRLAAPLSSQFDPTRTLVFDSQGATVTDTTADTIEQYHWVDAAAIESHLVSLKQRSGELVYSISYLDSDRIDFVEDAHGGRTKFSYDSSQRLAEIQDPAGRVTRLTIDDAGDLREIIFADGEIRRFDYDDHRLISATHPDGEVASYSYSPDGTLLSASRPGGGTTTIAPALSAGPKRDANGRLYYEAGLVDPRGVTHKYEVDIAGNLVSDTYSADGTAYVVKNVYAATLNGQDANTNIPNRLLRFSSTTVNGLLVTPFTHWDSTGRAVVAAQSPNITSDNHIGSLTFDALGRLTTHDFGTTDLDWLYSYDSAGHLTRIADREAGVGETGRESLWGGFRASDGQPTSVTAHGVATTLSYDARGNLSQAVDSLGHSLAITSDAAGNPTRVTSSVTSTDYTYDAAGRVTSVTDAENNTTTLSYQDTGCACSNGDRLRTLVTPDLAAGQSWSFDYDADGRLSKIKNPLGEQETFVFDAAGDLVAASDRANRATTVTHDHLGRPARVTDIAGRLGSYTYAIPTPGGWTGPTLYAQSQNGSPAPKSLTASLSDGQYQVGSNVIASGADFSHAELYRDPTFELAFWNQFDALGRPKWRTDRSTLPIDATQTGPTGHTSLFTSEQTSYGPYGNPGPTPRLIETLDKYNSSRYYDLAYTRNVDFDVIDMPSLLGDAKASGLKITRDIAGRITATEARYAGSLYGLETLPPPDGREILVPYFPSPSAIFYGATGKVETIIGHALTQELGYDSRGLLSTRELKFTGTHQPTPRGFDVGTFRYFYDSVGRNVRLQYPEGHERLQQYDSLGRLTSRCYVYADGSSQRCYTSTYDAVGNPRIVTDPETRREIEYDSLDRVVEVRRYVPASDSAPAYVERYSYNALGGFSVYDNAVVDDQRPRLAGGGTASAGIPATLSGAPVGMDRGGRVTSLGSVAFRYFGVDNRLQSILDGGNEKRFNYDPWFRRASTADYVATEPNRQAGSAYLYYASEDNIAAIDPSLFVTSPKGLRYEHDDGPGQAFIYDGLDQPLWLVDQESWLTAYYEIDTLGNVRRLHLSQDFSLQNSPNYPPQDMGGYAYSAFGKRLTVTDPGGTSGPQLGGAPYDRQPFLWQGRPTVANNLYDFRARIWSTELGAFLQPDQYVYLSRGGTLWSWPGNNPFRWRDPSGRERTASDYFMMHADAAIDTALGVSGVAFTIATLGAGAEVGLALAEGRLALAAAGRLALAGAAKGAILGGGLETGRQLLTKPKCRGLDGGLIADAAFAGAVSGALFGARGGIPTGITRGSQVTEQTIRDAMKGAPLQSQQAGGVSLPTVQRYVDKLLSGEVAPAIKVDGQIIVDGNHRYIAGRILGQEPAIQPWLGGRGPVVPWSEIKISTEW